MLSAEGIGKNIEQAIENALFELKAPREDVDIKILSEGGLFKKARVLVTISEDAKAKYEKHTVKETVKETKEETTKEEITKEEKKITKEEKKETKEEEKENKKEVKKQEKVLKKEEKEVEEEKVDVDSIEEGGDVKGVDPVEFLEGLFKAAGKDVQINTNEDEKYVTYSVVGENLGDMIGHRGECYYAINRVLCAAAGKTEKRILLDIGGYKERRSEVLAELAKKTAEKVVRTGRYARLDPMNPSERRIIHATLADDPRVVTMSRGEEPHRYVMVFLKEEND